MTTRKRKVAAIGIGALLLLMSGALLGYWLQHAMSPVQSFQKGLPSSPQRVLVATQGSAFKNRLVTALSEQLQKMPVYVNVVDVDDLDGIDAASWNAIVIVHTWEFGQPPRAVSNFVARTSDPSKLIDVTTSGSGREKVPGVDVISSASVTDEVPDLVKQIGTKIEARLAKP